MFQFESFAALISMDGHGPYVWASYGVTFLALILLVLPPMMRQRQTLIRLKRQIRIDQGLAKQGFEKQSSSE